MHRTKNLWPHAIALTLIVALSQTIVHPLQQPPRSLDACSTELATIEPQLSALLNSQGINSPQDLALITEKLTVSLAKAAADIKNTATTLAQQQNQQPQKESRFFKKRYLLLLLLLLLLSAGVPVGLALKFNDDIKKSEERTAAQAKRVYETYHKKRLDDFKQCVGPTVTQASEATLKAAEQAAKRLIDQAQQSLRKDFDQADKANLQAAKLLVDQAQQALHKDFDQTEQANLKTATLEAKRLVDETQGGLRKDFDQADKANLQAAKLLVDEAQQALRKDFDQTEQANLKTATLEAKRLVEEMQGDLRKDFTEKVDTCLQDLHLDVIQTSKTKFQEATNLINENRQTTTRRLEGLDNNLAAVKQHGEENIRQCRQEVAAQLENHERIMGYVWTTVAHLIAERQLANAAEAHEDSFLDRTFGRDTHARTVAEILLRLFTTSIPLGSSSGTGNKTGTAKKI